MLLKIGKACHTEAHRSEACTAHLNEAIARYHEILDRREFRDLSWAAQLQDDMRAQGLTDSGRLLTPVLRPHFLTKEQVTRMGSIAAKLTGLLAKVEAMAMGSPPLLGRLGMLPAEKALAALPCGYARPNVASRLDATVHNGSLSVRGFEAFSAVGLAYADVLADLFLHLPVMHEFGKAGYQVEKVGGTAELLRSIVAAWTEFGGAGRRPTIAVLQAKPVTAQGGEAEFIAAMFRRAGVQALAAIPEQLEFSAGKLRVGDTQLDVVFRRLDTRQMLVRCELTHPLLAAYRAGSVCLVNGFQSEMWERRATFEMLTSEEFAPTFSSAERKLIRECIPWTRLLGARRTLWQEENIDLLPFVLRHRERLVLRPNDITSDLPSYSGTELPAGAWERALRLALRAPYVVQEACESKCESFPVYRYGELGFEELAVSVIPRVLSGAMQGASAVLETRPASTARRLALAPIFSVQ